MSALDMTMMYAFHDALRREVERIARVAARQDGDPREVLRTAVGWQMFKEYLRVHHTSEDDALWPPLQSLLDGRPADLALLGAMEAEHAAIDPLLEAVDAALADRDSGPERLGGLVDALATGLGGHLRHEEKDALPLIGATLAQEQWARFGDLHRTRIGSDLPRYLPWVLDGAGPARAERILGGLPAPLLAAYRDEWRPAYVRLGLWADGPLT
ncbi:hemerythrin domain-containing protein [Phytohabitans sp. ZYX-F-186]|uniref:Hemerythrin domain-containing protein n=1 Tax=Phytohabitans maris TaxID=3071409 RepID=A0ABU0ZVG5_9ACTN|nr:hemerythrin domain-containing protein [Phytohabitans sp. ZYX-F-186]MDQ7910945.1 hemerythrin domain-containing protein [Phytohabitans sp. ZYX-F-186]